MGLVFLHEHVDDLAPFAQLLQSDGFALRFGLASFSFDELDAFSAYLGPPSCVDAVGSGAVAVAPPACVNEGISDDDETQGRVCLYPPLVKDRGNDHSALLGLARVPGCL